MRVRNTVYETYTVFLYITTRHTMWHQGALQSNRRLPTDLHKCVYLTQAKECGLEQPNLHGITAQRLSDDTIITPVDLYLY